MKRLIFSAVWILMVAGVAAQQKTVFKGFRIVDGISKTAMNDADMLVESGKIAAIGKPGSFKVPADATLVQGNGQTIIPALVLAHGHLGQIKGTQQAADNYTSENIRSQLLKYQAYGISTILSLGTDQEIIFPLRDSSRRGQLPGARIYTAGYGISIAKGPPPPGSLTPKIQRASSPDEARKAVQLLVPLKPDFVKIWVDDFGGKLEKMPFAIYQAVIEEAHKHGLRVAAHVYYLEDARRLANLGVDVLAHSIRDKEVDDDLIRLMKQRGIYYIPTLTLDEYNFAYGEKPAWIDDPFFKASLEPGMLDTLTSENYKTKINNDPDLKKKIAAFNMAKRNLLKLFLAGIPIAMGTDSGAQPVRTQGFSEHLELQLMVESGISPIDVLRIATSNGAAMLREKSFGSLTAGKQADFIVLSGNPVQDIKQSKSIESVWKNGMQVSEGKPQ